jgi:WD40 repeat protein
MSSMSCRNNVMLMTSSRGVSLSSSSPPSAPSLQLLHTLSHPASSITAVLFCPNHRHALYSTADRIINLIATVPAASTPYSLSSSSSSPAVIRSYSPPHGYDITDIAISPVSSSLLFSVSSDRHCCITAVETAQTVRKMQAHEQRINSVAVHEGEAVFITGGNDGIMKVWDLRARGGRGGGGGREVQVMKEAKDSVTSVAFLYDRPHVICSCSADGCLRLYDARRGEVAVQRTASALSSVFPSRQGGAVLLSSLSSRLLLFDTSPPSTSSSPLLRSFSSPHYRNLHYSLRCALLREGTEVVSGSESSNALLVWDVQSGKLVAQWGGEGEQGPEATSSSSSSSKQGVQTAVDWDEHQSLLMAGSTVGDVRLWQVSF